MITGPAVGRQKLDISSLAAQDLVSVQLGVGNLLEQVFLREVA